MILILKRRSQAAEIAQNLIQHLTFDFYHLNVLLLLSSLLLLKTYLKVREVCRRPRLLGLSQMPGRRTLFRFCQILSDFVRCQNFIVLILSGLQLH